MRTLLPLLLLLVSACSQNPVVKLYDGPDRAASELVALTVPMELEILTINDRRIEGAGTMFAFGSRTLMLEPGSYRIVAYYKNLFPLTGDEHEVVKSDPVVFSLEGEAGEKFALDFDRPADVEEARHMASRFEGWVENRATGERRPGRPSGLVVTSGFMGVLSDQTPEAPPVATVAPEAPSAATSSSSGPALETLKNAWQQATPEERREFLLWMSR